MSAWYPLLKRSVIREPSIREEQDGSSAQVFRNVHGCDSGTTAKWKDLLRWASVRDHSLKWDRTDDDANDHDDNVTS